jgi:hypothetical protein
MATLFSFVTARLGAASAHAPAGARGSSGCRAQVRHEPGKSPRVAALYIFACEQPVCVVVCNGVEFRVASGNACHEEELIPLEQ